MDKDNRINKMVDCRMECFECSIEKVRHNLTWYTYKDTRGEFQERHKGHLIEVSVRYLSEGKSKGKQWGIPPSKNILEKVEEKC